MAIIMCPECGGKVSDKAKACPHCGYPIQELAVENITYKNNTKQLIEEEHVNDAGEIDDKINDILCIPSEDEQIVLLNMLIDESHHPLAYETVGKIYFDNEKYQNAINILKDSLIYNPTYGDAYAYIGLWTIQIGTEQGVEPVEEVIDAYEKGIKLRSLKAYIYMAALYDPCALERFSIHSIKKDVKKSFHYWKEGIEEYYKTPSHFKLDDVSMLLHAMGMGYNNEFLHVHAAGYYHIGDMLNPSNGLCHKAYIDAVRVVLSDYDCPNIWIEKIEQIKTPEDIMPMIISVNKAISDRIISLMEGNISYLAAFDKNTDYSAIRKIVSENKEALSEDEFISFIKELIKKSHSNLAYNTLMHYYDINHLEEEKRKVLEEQVQFAPDDIMAHLNLGMSYASLVNEYNREYNQKAIDQFIQAANLGSVLGCFMLFYIYKPESSFKHFKKNPEMAISYAKKGIDLYLTQKDKVADSKDKERAVTLCNGIANLRKKEGRAVTVTCLYKIAYEINPTIENKNIYISWIQKIRREYGDVWVNSIEKVKTYQDIQPMIIDTNKLLGSSEKERAIADTSKMNIPRCPTCKSTNIKPISGGLRWLSVEFFGLSSSNIGKTYVCKDCGYKW